MNYLFDSTLDGVIQPMMEELHITALDGVCLQTLLQTLAYESVFHALAICIPPTGAEHFFPGLGRYDWPRVHTDVVARVRSQRMPTLFRCSRSRQRCARLVARMLETIPRFPDALSALDLTDRLHTALLYFAYTCLRAPEPHVADTADAMLTVRFGDKVASILTAESPRWAVVLTRMRHHVGQTKMLINYPSFSALSWQRQQGRALFRIAMHAYEDSPMNISCLQGEGVQLLLRDVCVAMAREHGLHRPASDDAAEGCWQRVRAAAFACARGRLDTHLAPADVVRVADFLRASVWESWCTGDVTSVFDDPVESFLISLILVVTDEVRRARGDLLQDDLIPYPGCLCESTDDDHDMCLDRARPGQSTLEQVDWQYFEEGLTAYGRLGDFLADARSLDALSFVYLTCGYPINIGYRGEMHDRLFENCISPEELTEFLEAVDILSAALRVEAARVLPPVFRSDSAAKAARNSRFAVPPDQAVVVCQAVIMRSGPNAPDKARGGGDRCSCLLNLARYCIDCQKDWVRGLEDYDTFILNLLAAYFALQYEPGQGLHPDTDCGGHIASAAEYLGRPSAPALEISSRLLRHSQYAAGAHGMHFYHIIRSFRDTYCALSAA